MPRVKSYLTPIVVVLDIQHKVAAIPGSGNTPVVFTTTADVAKFVVASLGLEKWTESSIIVGDRKTWNEVLTIAEKVTGMIDSILEEALGILADSITFPATKFQTSYDSVEKLQQGQITELPGHVPVYQFFPKQMLQGMFAMFGYWFETGEFNLKVTERTYLNEKFPEIRTKSIEELITEAWA